MAAKATTGADEMTTTITMTIRDEIAETMKTQSPDIYLDVFGGVRIRETYELVGQWW